MGKKAGCDNDGISDDNILGDGDILDEINDEMEDTTEDKRSKSLRQHLARQKIEEQLEERQLNYLLNLDYYDFDDGDEE
jgi:hypothetical protein